MRETSQHMANLFLVVILIASSMVWPDSEILKISTGERTVRIPVFNIWWDQSDSYTVQSQEAKTTFQIKTEYFLSQIKIDRDSMIMRSYFSHNQLHFNIPLTCCKFSISQYTCDG